MKLTILGSGGAMTTPRPFCQCSICTKARKLGEPYKRNNSSLFINDINTLIDCGEDIADSLNRRDIKKIDRLLITHWHPDHTFGLRPLLEAHYNFRTHQTDKTIDLYIPKKVFKTLRQKLPTIDYWLNYQKTAKLHLIEHGDTIKINNISIEVVGYNGKNSDIYAYLIHNSNKRALYAPCDTIDFKYYENIKNLDLLINECGMFSKHKTEITFDNLMKRMKENTPKKLILTHIEEVELRTFGENIFSKMKNNYPDINFDFAFDGLKITL